MKKTACIALTTLLLAVGATGAVAAEPPDLAFANDNTRGAPQDILLLSTETLETVTGAGWRAGACTFSIRAIGTALVIGGFLSRNPVMEGIGIFARRLECY